MNIIILKEEDKIRLNKIWDISPDTARQEAWNKFWKYLYDTYKLNKKRYYSAFKNGRIIMDNNRVRVEPVQKISKSDQNQDFKNKKSVELD